MQTLTPFASRRPSRRWHRSPDFVAELHRWLAPDEPRAGPPLSPCARSTTRTLRDLGFAPLAKSVGLAAEIGGRADVTYVRALQARQLTRLSRFTTTTTKAPSMHAAIANARSHPCPSRSDTDRYAKCIESVQAHPLGHRPRRHPRPPASTSRKKFLPDGLSKVGELAFLQPAEARFLSQVQGRTYANMFALVERFIGAKTLELGRRPPRWATRSRSRRWCGSPTRS